MPICETCPTGSVGRAMMRRRMVCREVWTPKRSVTRTPSLPPVARPMICKDFSWVGALLAKVLADLDEQTNGLSCAWQIGDVARVAAMHTSGRAPTQRTTRGQLSRNKGHGENVVSFLQPTKVESLGQGQDWLHFLHRASDPSLKHGSLSREAYVNRWVEASKQAESPRLCQFPIMSSTAIGSRSSRSTSEHLHSIFVHLAWEKTGKLKTPLAPAILASEGYFVVV
jgi:hypothetical protein